MNKISLINKKIVMLGFGTIGPPSLSLILKHTKINPKQITVIADQDNNSALAENLGVKFENLKLTHENYIQIIGSYLKTDDILINLSVGISSFDLITVCQQKGILYLDTSNERWSCQNTVNEDKNETNNKTTTFERRQNLLQARKNFLHGPTALVCHGANPGLVTHFAKRAILDVATTLLPSFEIPKRSEDWGKLAYQCEISSIHISERDSQYSSEYRNPNEYVNTWSIEGFLDEVSEPVGFAWGTHENADIDELVSLRIDSENCRVIELKRKAFETKMYSWVPNFGIFTGYLIPHPEAYSIAELFNYQIDHKTFYQPTVHFVYKPCNDAVSSMNEAATDNWNLDKNKRILQNDIQEGMDALGILIIFKNSNQIYWYGSQLSIQDTREFFTNSNATSLQVAAGVLSGLIWLLENPNMGLIESEQTNFDRILEIAAPYLGELAGHWSHWPESEAQKITGKALQTRYLSGA